MEVEVEVEVEVEAEGEADVEVEVEAELELVGVEEDLKGESPADVLRVLSDDSTFSILSDGK